jgi:hypothetical protein
VAVGLWTAPVGGAAAAWAAARAPLARAGGWLQELQAAYPALGFVAAWLSSLLWRHGIGPLYRSGVARWREDRRWRKNPFIDDLIVLIADAKLLLGPDGWQQGATDRGLRGLT